MAIIDLIRNAKAKKMVTIDADIKLGDTTIKAALSTIDSFTLWRNHQDLRDVAYARYVADGLDKMKPDLSKWQLEYDKAKPEMRESMERDKPINLAEQKAREEANYMLIIDIIPRFLRDPETNELLFATAEEQKEFKDYIKLDPELLSYLATKYTELTTKNKELEEQVKN